MYCASINIQFKIMWYHKNLLVIKMEKYEQIVMRFGLQSVIVIILVLWEALKVL